MDVGLHFSPVLGAEFSLVSLQITLEGWGTTGMPSKELSCLPEILKGNS